MMRHLPWLILPVLCFACQIHADDSDRTLAVGAAAHLGDDSHGNWTSSDEKIVEVLDNGIALALTPGDATIRGGTKTIKDYHITVTRAATKLVDPSRLEQYPDHRVFHTSDGRKCVGTVLNGQMLGNEDQTGKSDHNRVQDPHPIDPGQPYLWELQPHTPIVDGTGALIGEIASTITTRKGQVPATKINFGMTKVIQGHFCVYAFSTRATTSPDARNSSKSQTAEGTSAWIPLDAVVKKVDLLEKVGVGKGKLPALPLEDQKYRVTGGNPNQYVLSSGHEVSITPDVSIGALPSHYLRRPSGTVNVCFCVPGFGLGGQALDSLLVTSGAIFQKARGAKEFVMPTYYPKGDPQEGKKAPPTETFWYGAVQVPNSETIYGWVAKEALAPDDSAPTGK